jgi:hypothetical protein
MAEKEKIIIDLTADPTINEDFSASQGAKFLLALQSMFGYVPNADIYVKGGMNAITAFSNAMQGEKRYIDAVNRYGLSNPKILSDKYKLRDAIERFERETKISWPFKN